MFQLVVRKGERPDRPDAETEQKVGLTDGIWDIIEASWRKDPRLRPTFSQVVHLWQEQAGTTENSRPGSSSDMVAGNVPFTAEISGSSGS